MQELSHLESATEPSEQHFSLCSLMFHTQRYERCMQLAAVVAIHTALQPATGLEVKYCFLLMEAALRLLAVRGVCSVEEQTEQLNRATSVFSIITQAKTHEQSPAVRSLIDFKLYLYKCRLFCQLQTNMKNAKREMKNGMEVLQHSLKPPQDGLSGDLQNCVLLSTVIASEGALSVEAAVDALSQGAHNLKACVEWVKGHHKKALRLLSACALRDGDAYVGENNLACIYLRLGKAESAGMHFRQALQSLQCPIDADLTGDCNAPLRHSYSADVVLNYALSLQLSGRPSEALAMYVAVTQVFSERVLLWLRMGECCVAEHNAVAAAKTKGQHNSLALHGRSRVLVLR